jgi:hypothetical protein
MTTATKNEMTITARCKAFDGEGVRENKIRIDADGTIRVWDAVAGHYTTCHGLSKAAQGRLRKLAASQA